MSLAAEMKDFLTGFTAMRQSLGTKASREAERARTDYTRTLADKAKWDMGAEQRENDNLIEFARQRGGGYGMGYDYPEGDAASSGVSASAPEITPDDVNAIVASAERIGADPRDYIAIMNYESGINPQRWGGAGGNYFGLIQFGGPERQQFGVREGQSIQEQLPSVEGFLKARGFKPGMGLAEMYSIINAGSLDRNGQPRWNASDGNGNVRSHVASIAKSHYPVANKLLQGLVGAPAAVAVEGLADLPNVAAIDDPDMTAALDDGIVQMPDTGKQAEDIDSMPGMSDGVAPEDDLGLNDPDYLRYKQERYGTPAPASAATGGDVITPEGDVMPQVASADGADGLIYDESGFHYPDEPAGDGAIPEDPDIDAGAEPDADTDDTAGGYDPLPQTSGYTDPVSAAGHDALAAVARGHNRGKTPFKNIIQGALDFGVKTFGLDTEEGIDTSDDNPAYEAFLSGHGAFNANLVSQLEDAIDPNDEMTDDQRQIEVLSTMWEYYMGKGEPEKAKGVTFKLYQTYKSVSQHYLAMAKASASDGDWETAADQLLAAYSVVPDGLSMDAVKNEDGSLSINTINAETKEVLYSTTVAPQDLPKFIMEKAMNIGPGDFDLMVSRAMGVGKPAAETEDDVATEWLQSGAMDEGDVREVPPPAPGAGGTGGAAGDELGAIPEDAPAEGDGAVIAGGGDGGDTSEVTMPIGDEPAKPMSFREYRERLLAAPNSTARAVVTDLYEKQQAEWRQWYTDNQAQVDRQTKLGEKEADLGSTENLNSMLADLYSMANAGEPIPYPEDALASLDAEDQATFRTEWEKFNKSRETRNVQNDKETSKQVLDGLLSQYQFDQDNGPSEAAIPEDTGPLGAIMAPSGFDTPVEGRTPTEARRFTLPDEETLAQLTTEDRAVLTSHLEDVNRRISEYNTGFDLNKPMQPDQTGQVTPERLQAVMDERLDQLIATRTQPEDKQMFTHIADYRARFPATDSLLTASAMEIARTPGNPGMTPERAMDAVIGMMAYNSTNPTQRTIRAEYVDQPNGDRLVRVMPMSGNKNKSIIMPEAVFSQLDDVRQQLTREALGNAGRAGFKAADDAEYSAGLDDFTKNHLDIYNTARPDFPAKDDELDNIGISGGPPPPEAAMKDDEYTPPSWEENAFRRGNRGRSGFPGGGGGG